MDGWMKSMQEDISDIKHAHTQIVKDLPQIKAEQTEMREEIEKLKVKYLLHDKEISSINGTLNEIKEDTKWIKRKIIQAIISAITTGIISTFIALAFGKFL